jgi:DNA-binding MarR family transcriptional regulator
VDFDEADAINQAIRMLSLRHRARAAALLASLGLHPGQEVLLLELARTGPMIQAQLSEALGCEPPSVTLMTSKLEASGHVRRTPAPSDKRASIVELTDSGKALASQVRQLWCTLAEETVTGLPPETAAGLPAILNAMAGNVDTRRPRSRQHHDRVRLTRYLPLIRTRSSHDDCRALAGQPADGHFWRVIPAGHTRTGGRPGKGMPAWAACPTITVPRE